MPRGKAWADFGEVIVCDEIEEMVREADRIASEHVQVMTRDPDYFLNNMKNYGSLFLGRAHQRGLRRQGDRHEPHAADQEGGALHRRAVGRQIPQDLHLSEVLTDEASAQIGEYCSRLCILEGFVAHAEQANVRVRRYGGRNIPYAQAAE